MLGDNETSLPLTRNPKSQNQTKNIDVMHYHICGLVKNGELAIEWIENLLMALQRLFLQDFSRNIKMNKV